MSISIRLKLIASFIVLGILPGVMLTTIFYRNIEQSIKTQSIKQETASLEVKVNNIEDAVNSHIGELKIANLHLPIQRIIRSEETGFDPMDNIGVDVWKARMETIFASTAKLHDDIYQLRYIDEKGQEQIRVNSIDGAVIVVSSEELQNKSDEAYFREAVKLPEGEIYLSSIELNKEQGEIQTPNVLVMIVATPVYDERDGAEKGIIVLNIFASSFFENLDNSPNASKIILADQNGNYFLNPDQNKIFSSETDNNFNYFTDQPELMKTIDLLSGEINYDAEAKQFRIWEKIFYDEKTRDRYWILTSVIEEVDLLGPVFVLRGFLTLAWLAIIIFILTIALLLAISISAPIHKLTKTIEEISKGNLKVDIDPGLLNSKSEIGKLAQAFNRTLVGLKLAMDQAKDKEKPVKSKDYESDSNNSEDREEDIQVFK